MNSTQFFFFFLTLVTVAPENICEYIAILKSGGGGGESWFKRYVRILHE